MMNCMINPMARLSNEYQFCCNDRDLVQLGCSFCLENNNIFTWNVSMLGPKNTPYENGLFRIRIIFPNDYPNHGPEFLFLNKIYHLNVNFNTNNTCEKQGHICISSINEWRNYGKVTDKNIYGVKQALIDIFCLFNKQGKDSPYDDKMAKLYRDNPEQFNKNAKLWTQQFAS